jgi:hypothetical protein
MIIKEAFTKRAHYDFSEEDKQRIQLIMNELKEIFKAESVGLKQTTLNGDTRARNDWIIEINSVPSTDIPQW